MVSAPTRAPPISASACSPSKDFVHSANRRSNSGHKSGNSNRKQCFNCQKFDHLSRECPEMQCYRCREFGHLSRDCQEKRGIKRSRPAHDLRQKLDHDRDGFKSNDLRKKLDQDRDDFKSDDDLRQKLKSRRFESESDRFGSRDVWGGNQRQERRCDQEDRETRSCDHSTAGIAQGRGRERHRDEGNRGRPGHYSSGSRHDETSPARKKSNISLKFRISRDPSSSSSTTQNRKQLPHWDLNSPPKIEKFCDVLSNSWKKN